MTHLMKFETGDELGVDFADIERFGGAFGISDFLGNLLRICGGNVFTIRKDDEVLIISGCSMDALNNASMFMLASKKLSEKFDREVLRVMREGLSRVKSKRIQGTCTENPRYKRFLEFLGFKQECLMNKYGINGEDIYLYVKMEEQDDS